MVQVGLGLEQGGGQIQKVQGRLTEPEIAVNHWPFSDQFQDLAEQN